MQQPTSPMMPGLPSVPPAHITSEQIQKYLDENKKLILAILENQNLGKLGECAQYQAQLQRNLMYLAAIADAQPQVATMPPQMAPHPSMAQQGAYYMQQQAAAMAQQGVFPPRMPAQFPSPAQLHELQQQQQHLLHQQAMPGQINFRPSGPPSGMHPIQSEPTFGGGTSGAPTPLANTSDTHRGNKQDGSEPLTGGSDPGNSTPSTGHNIGEGGDTSYMQAQKGSEGK